MRPSWRGCRSGSAAASRAYTGRFMGHDLTRQMLGQRLAEGMATWFGGHFRCPGILGLLCLRAGGILLEIADQQFQPLDIAIKLLRRTAEPCPSQDGQLRFQFFDMQRRGVDLRRIGGDLDFPCRPLRRPRTVPCSL